MKESRNTKERIAFALKQAKTGTPVAEVLRRMGSRSRRSGSTLCCAAKACRSTISESVGLDRNEGLSPCLKRPRRHVSAVHRERSAAASGPNALWSMDFVSDALFDDRRLRALTVVDAYTREALVIEVDNGPKFVSKALDRWTYENRVTLDLSRPGKPTDNAFIASFHGRFRDECLNAHWFLSLADARAKMEAWGLDDNENRSHTSLGWMTPSESAAAAALKSAE